MSTNERCRLSYIWIVGFFKSYFGVRPVPGIDTGIFRQSKQLVPDALAQGFTVPAREIRSSNAAIEQSITDKYGFFCGTVKTNTSGGAPYGITWEEMGLKPWEDLEENE